MQTWYAPAPLAIAGMTGMFTDSLFFLVLGLFVDLPKPCLGNLLASSALSLLLLLGWSTQKTASHKQFSGKSSIILETCLFFG